jgi:magnesium transporter
MKSEANKLLVSTIKKLLHRRASPQLHKVIDRSHSADLAYAVNLLTRGERRVFFEFIEDVDKAAEVVTEVEPRVQSELLDMLTDSQILKLVGVWSSDDTADILSSMEEERRELLLTMMQRDELATTQSLMGYDPETAGGLMVPEFFALEETTTAREAIAELQEDAGRTEMVFYLYVVNEHGHLVGVTSLRELVLARPGRPLGEFMISEVVRVELETDQEEVARLIARYNLVALPVVDANNHLRGVVTVDDIIDVIRSEATEDMMLMAGAGDQSIDEYGSLLAGLRARLPWLLPSLIGGVGAGAALVFAQDQVTRLAPLVAFVPLVMTLGGNISNQSAAIVTRGLALGRADFKRLGRVLLSELAVGLGAGVVYGAVIAAVAWAVFGADADVLSAGVGPFVGVVAASLAVSLSVAAAVGALIPMVFSRLGLDPALATGPLVIPAVDVLGLWIFFGFASAAL